MALTAPMALDRLEVLVATAGLMLRVGRAIRLLVLVDRG